MEIEENIGVEEQEVAEPATEEETVETPEEEVGETAPAEQEQEPQLTNDQWRSVRLKAEQKAKSHYDNMIRQRFGSINNPATGKPIESVEDYLAALDAQQEAARQRTIRAAASKLDSTDAETLMAAIRNDPERKRLEEKMNAMQEELDAREGERQLNAQMAEIRKIDPSVTGIEYLAQQPEFEDFDRRVRAGYDLVDAYKLAFSERRASANMAAAKQAAINEARSKGHLAPVGGEVGTPDDGLTDEIIANYRLYNPGMSRKEIAKYHARYKK